MTEQFKVGLQPPIRESGDIADSPGCTLESPSGSVKIDRGVICALRHIHMTPADALRYGDLPAINSVELHARIDRDQILVQSLAAEWQQAKLAGEASVPIRMVLPEPAPGDTAGTFGAWRAKWLAKQKS